MNLQLVVPSQTFSKVSPLEVEQWLDQKDASFLEIVDLRQQDFAGGNIPGCIHINFSEFESKIEEIVSSCLSRWRASGAARDRSKVLFTCMYGGERGPSSALRFVSELDVQLNQNAQDDECLLVGPKIYVIIGGFSNWLNTFVTKRPELVENFREEFWVSTPEGFVYKSDVPSFTS